jgi:quercetin dioxygenase-like cupin family protein
MRIKYQIKFCLAFLITFLILLGCSEQNQDVNSNNNYQKQSTGTRILEWDDINEIGWIKVLIEESNFGEKGVEIAEIYFPPGYQDIAHMHQLEILYVLEGELDHIVNGVSHILTPGMIGIVKEPDLVVHRSNSENGVRVLLIWPYGKEIQILDEEGLREIKLN